MKSRYLELLVLIFLIPTTVHAFQIDLPKHYSENLQKKRLKESAILWNELDRTELENAVRSFVAGNEKIDGADISRTAETLTWGHTTAQAISLGKWYIILEEWEYSYPSLKRINWNSAKLVLDLEYDFETKKIQDGGNAVIRLYFNLKREGALLSKKIIHIEFESADYGVRVYMMPFGGVELQKTKHPETEN